MSEVKILYWVRVRVIICNFCPLLEVFIVQLLQAGFQASIVAHLSEKLSSQIANPIVTMDGKSSSVAA